MMILQVSEIYKTQTAGDIFSISKDLQNIIQEDIENQACYIQSLLADKLDRCKEKRNTHTNEYIKEIQNTYKKKTYEIEQLITVDKGKQPERQV